MKRRSCFHLGLLVAFVLVFVAVSSVAASTDTEFDSVDVPAGGISFDYPSSWTVMPRTKAALRRQVRALRNEDPQLAELVAENARVDLQPSTLKARVLDARGYLMGRYTGNIRVYVHSGDRLPATLDAYMSRFALLTDAAKTTVEDTSALRVDGKRRAYRVDMRQSVDGTPGEVRSTWLTLPYRDGDVSVHITLFEDDQAGEMLIDRIVDGVHLK